MKRQAFPLFKYIAPGFLLVVSFSSWVFQQYLQQLPWWPTLPWLWLFVAVAAFAMGTLYADLTDPSSVLRRWFRDREGVFEIAFHPSSAVEDGIDRNVPKFSIRAIRACRNVQLEILLYENVQFSVNRGPVVLQKFTYSDYSAGETKEIVIGSFVKTGQSVQARSVWVGPDNRSPLGRAGHLVDLVVKRGGRLVQRYGVFISYGEAETTAHQYSFVEEGRRIFEGPARL